MLSGLIDRAFENFDSDRVLELVKVDDDCQILELFHGPTLACKDLSLSCVGQLFDHFTRTGGSRCTALVGEYFGLFLYADCYFWLYGHVAKNASLRLFVTV